MRLKEKTAIITGGTAGIGKGIACEFIREGASVVITGSNVAKGLAAQAELGPKATFIQADSTSTESIKHMVQEALRVLKKLDILVNNAGYADGKDVESQTEDEWNHLFNVNVNGYARCIRSCLPYLKESRGVMLNTSSMVGMRGQDHAFGYCATKGAIIGMTKNLAIDLAKYGIRVNALCPGWIVTENMRENWTKLQPEPQKAIPLLDASHPLKRAGTPKDCGRAAAYLCSSDGEFITGITLELDGGITLGYPNSLF